MAYINDAAFSAARPAPWLADATDPTPQLPARYSLWRLD